MGRAIALTDIGTTDQTYIHFAKATDPRFNLVRDIMTALEQEGVEAVVAPYEADAQLAYLSKAGLVDLVMTEDSDLLVYGCNKVLFKWDPVSMFGVEVSGSLCDAIPFRGLSSGDAVTACILAGCDYSPGIHGIGISKAIELVRCCSRNDIDEVSLEDVMERAFLKVPFTDDANRLIKSLRIAKLVFNHQTVFSTGGATRLIPLNPSNVDQELSEYAEYLGKIYSDIAAEGVYRGLCHPVTLRPYMNQPFTSTEPRSLQLGNIVLNS